MLVWGWMRCGCGECRVGSTYGSGIVSSAADVLWMRGVGDVGEMCVCV